MAEAEEAERDTLGAPTRFEGPLDVLLAVAAAAEPVGAAAGTLAAAMSQDFVHKKAGGTRYRMNLQHSWCACRHFAAAETFH